MNNFYVYAYCDPDRNIKYVTDVFTFDYEPFYIGLGSLNRINEHLLIAKKGNYKNLFRYNKIRKLLENNKEPIIIKIIDEISREKSAEIEISLIKQIGTRVDIDGVKRGPLTNLTLGGDGIVAFKMPRRDPKTYDVNSGKIGMRKNGIYILVHKHEIDKKISEGWIIGYGDKTKTEGTKNKIWINKENKRQCIFRNELNSYLNDGWVIGSNSKTSLGKILIHKNKVQIQVDKDKLQSYLNDGWIKGMNRKNNSTGKIWIKNASEKRQKYILPEELEKYLKQGWLKGSLKKHEK